MARLIFDLTDEDRAALERARIKLGLRSHAEALRELVRRFDGDPGSTPLVAGPHPVPPGGLSFGHGREGATTLVGPSAGETVHADGGYEVQVGPAPFVPGSRLKKR